MMYKALFLLVLGLALSASLAQADQGLKPMKVGGGEVVYDSHNRVYWLVDANFAASQEGRAIQTSRGVTGVDPNGAMDYATAQAWVAALNASRYLGHSDWQLPATPMKDPTCGAGGPGGASFGGLCRGGALGSLYYLGLNYSFPANAAPFPGANIPPFQHVQLSYYWTDTSGGVSGGGEQIFSFSSGLADVTETHDAYYHVLPMVRDRPIGGAAAAPTCPSGSDLALYTQGPAANHAVYDCRTRISWLADANLAASDAFGLSGNVEIHYNRPYPKRHPITLTVPQINDGAMLWETAKHWVAALKAKGYLGSHSWQLPGSPTDLQTLYEHLKLASGDPRFSARGKVGPFRNVQPFFYWEVCVPDPNGPGKTSPDCDRGNAPPGKLGRQLDFDFSFGYGLQSTDLAALKYFVIVYYPAPLLPRPPVHTPPCTLGTKCK